jgi:hypothetical protein
VKLDVEAICKVPIYNIVNQEIEIEILARRDAESAAGRVQCTCGAMMSDEFLFYLAVINIGKENKMEGIGETILLVKVRKKNKRRKG